MIDIKFRIGFFTCSIDHSITVAFLHVRLAVVDGDFAVRVFETKDQQDYAPDDADDALPEKEDAADISETTKYTFDLDTNGEQPGAPRIDTSSVGKRSEQW